MSSKKRVVGLLSHGVLQGAAHRGGGQYYFIFAVLRALFSYSTMSLFCLETCTRREGNLVKRCLIKKRVSHLGVKRLGH